jgi:hypothetical protein
MALNPPTLSNLPQSFPGEYFILRRRTMRMIVKGNDLGYEQDGEVFVSTLRIVFVGEEVVNGVSGFGKTHSTFIINLLF